MAEERGSIRALGALGELYLEGKGVSRNPLNAVKYFEKGMSKGDPECIYFYAFCMENGKGTLKDPDRARDLYRRAAELGHEKAITWCRTNNVEFAHN
jgi:TPR repeat protein